MEGQLQSGARLEPTRKSSAPVNVTFPDEGRLWLQASCVKEAWWAQKNVPYFLLVFMMSSQELMFVKSCNMGRKTCHLYRPKDTHWPSKPIECYSTLIAQTTSYLCALFSDPERDLCTVQASCALLSPSHRACMVSYHTADLTPDLCISLPSRISPIAPSALWGFYTHSTLNSVGTTWPNSPPPYG